ncbi:MAG: septal ring lytic transglycosylase RlpA family protein [Acidobacteria bacterium]|nr:septal ring lytic transglycosylase RlpA family protein [Acidobacteriota bacterium]
MRRRIAQGLMALLFVVGLGAAQRPHNSGSKQVTSSTQPMAVTPAVKGDVPVKPRSKAYQIGTASWYGEDFQGKPTASGELYNMYDFTAAHPALPLGSWVKVTNLRNGRAVVVRINDRGPIVDGRIIDVSYGVAQALHFKSHGLQRVRLDVVRPPQEMAMLRPVAY